MEEMPALFWVIGHPESIHILTGRVFLFFWRELSTTDRAVILFPVQLINRICDTGLPTEASSRHVCSDAKGADTCATAVAGKDHERENGRPKKEFEPFIKRNDHFIRFVQTDEFFIQTSLRYHNA